MIRTASNAGVAVLASLAFAATSPDAAGAGHSGASPVARTEIQIGLCMPPDRIATALDLHPVGAAVEVWLFDDAALTLFERGLRLRLRFAKASYELTLKVADQDCARLAAGLVPPGEGKCEYDMHGATATGAVSLNRSVSPSVARSLSAGRLPPAEALSAAQTRYLREGVGTWPLPANIRPLGPQTVVSYRARDKPYVVDVSQVPSGETFVEITRKVPPADAARLRMALLDELNRAGVAICADQSAQAANKLRALTR